MAKEEGEGGSRAERRAVTDGDHTLRRRCDSDKTSIGFHRVDTGA
jgi:hypothetical protein